jgi:hypothetical protein
MPSKDKDVRRELTSAADVAAVDEIESAAFLAGWLAKARCEQNAIVMTWEQAFLLWRQEVEDATKLS